MQDDQNIITKVCQNCSKPFPQQKIDLHEAYCRKNIKKCPVCMQMYDINEQQKHEKQFHSKKECRYCALSLPEKQWEDHQPSCKRRPVKCKFCQNDIAYEEVLKHEEDCGSKITQCEICKKHFALREIKEHKITCVQRISPIRNESRRLSRDQLRQNIRDLPPNSIRIPTDERRPYENRPLENHRNHQIPSYEDPFRRNERGSNQRINAMSAEKPKQNGREQPKINFQTNIKPSHIIERERMRQLVDPVPISIRLAMEKSNKKVPLQNRN